MPTVTYVGPDVYGSVDPETGQPIQLATGESAEVSDTKAEQLLADFPQWFTGGGKGDSDTAAPSHMPRTHAELDQLAAERGVTLAEGMTVAEKQAALA